MDMDMDMDMGWWDEYVVVCMIINRIKIRSTLQYRF